MSQVLLLGGDLAAYAAALELAEVGIKVWFTEPSVTIPHEPVRDPGGEISGFLQEIEAPLTAGGPATPGAHPRVVAQPRVVLRARDGAWKPVPELSVWGIPAVPLSKECMAMLGSGGAFRAYLDRLKPVLTIGKEHNLRKLVDSRLGKATRSTLVEPIVYERFGVRTDEAEVARVEPGLNAALTRAGSLSGGVMQQREEHVARETVIEPESGWRGLAALLLERLRLYGAEPFPATVVSCEPSEHGWTVTDDTGEQHHCDGIVGGLDEVSRIVGQPATTDSAIVEHNGASGIVDHLVALRPGAVRQYVEKSIEPGPNSPPASDATAALFLVDSESSETWAARVTRSASGDAVLRLSGPAKPTGAEGAAPVAEALAAAGATATAAPPVVRTSAAAHATASERDAQAAARAAWAEAFPTMIVAGAALHGAALGEALAEARTEAVRLRRKLTGISK